MPPEPLLERLPLPVVIIGGYLGAGKTTLLNHLLRHAQGRRVAVLVNDFGDVNIDAALIESADDTVLSLAGGCLCCAFGDDLLGTLDAVARREPAPDVVLIELSGVALPAQVARSLQLSQSAALAGILVLADAADVQRLCADRYVGDVVQAQLQSAHWLLLHKPDRVDADTWAALPGWLAQQAPQARLLAGPLEEFPCELVLAWSGQTGLPQLEEASAPQVFAGRPIGADARAGSRYCSVSVALHADVDLHQLGQALSGHPLVLRAKGSRWRVEQGRRVTDVLQVAGSSVRVSTQPQGALDALVLIGLGEAEPLRAWLAGHGLLN